MAEAEAESPAPKKGPSFVLQAVLLLVLTAAALGVGWFAGGYLKEQVEPQASVAGEKASANAQAGHSQAGGHGGEAAGEGEPGSATTLFDLAPITTNLAAPNDVWARLEVAILFDAPPADRNVVEIVHQDLLSYLRTVKMHQLEGASGIQHLKADLEERAAIRSEGHVKGVFIRTLLFE